MLNQELVAPLSLLEQVETAYHHQASQQEIELRASTVSGCPDIHVDLDRIEDLPLSRDVAQVARQAAALPYAQPR